jgi:antitoxin HicB
MDGDYTIIFEPCEEGGYTAFIPEVPGAISEGETIEEAREMVLDALRELTDYRRREALKGASGTAVVETLRKAA